MAPDPLADRIQFLGPRPHLRASCETDLMAHQPIHAAVSWLANTPTVALKHYLQVLDSDFEKAAKGGAESGAVVA